MHWLSDSEVKNAKSLI